MALIAVGALVLGILAGQWAPSSPVLSWLTYVPEYTDAVLFVLMITVGISVGANRVVLRKLREMDLRILLLPFGVILGSLAGGALCTALNPFSLGANLAVSAGMGWYSLSGVLLGEALGADIGAVSFLSNLIREFLSFLLIPLAVKTLNSYAAIALAGATSEDTALPVLIRHAPEETVVYSVLSGVLTSAAVPVLSRLFIALAGG